jgi:hypothetical protein
MGRIPSVVGGLNDFYVQRPRSREDYPKIIEIYELEYMNNIIGMAWLKIIDSYIALGPFAVILKE